MNYTIQRQSSHTQPDPAIPSQIQPYPARSSHTQPSSQIQPYPARPSKTRLDFCHKTRQTFVTDLTEKGPPLRGVLSPAPPPQSWGPPGTGGGKADRRDGKGDGDGRGDGTLGPWGPPGCPWNSCRSPGVPQRPLGAPRGARGPPFSPRGRGSRCTGIPWALGLPPGPPALSEGYQGGWAPGAPGLDARSGAPVAGGPSDSTGPPALLGPSGTGGPPGPLGPGLGPLSTGPGPGVPGATRRQRYIQLFGCPSSSPKRPEQYLASLRLVRRTEGARGIIINNMGITKDKNLDRENGLGLLLHLQQVFNLTPIYETAHRKH